MSASGAGGEKAPRAAAGLPSAAALESNVQAATEQISVERDVPVSSKAAIEATIEVAEVNKEIFSLHADIADDAHFKAPANGPAGVGSAAPGNPSTPALMSPTASPPVR
jgi:hypothetical protein